MIYHILATILVFGMTKADELFPGQSGDKTAHNIVLSPLDGETKVTLRNGQEFCIRLEGNPTTGYVWNLRTTKDMKVVIPSGPEEFVKTEEAEKDGKLVGQAGYYDFPFKTVTPGEKTLVFVYHRPWEKDTEPARTVQIIITVKE